MVLGRNDANVPDEARYAHRPPLTSPDLIYFNRMQIAWVLWAQRVNEISERKFALRHGQSSYEMNALAAALESWADSTHDEILLKRVRKEYGKPFICVQRWKEMCYRIENQLSSNQLSSLCASGMHRGQADAQRARILAITLATKRGP